MAFNEFIYTVMIKENHLDTFGHVNNAAYLTLYEEARWDFITKNGYGLEVIQNEKKGPMYESSFESFGCCKTYEVPLQNLDFLHTKTVHPHP